MELGRRISGGSGGSPMRELEWALAKIASAAGRPAGRVAFPAEPVLLQLERPESAADPDLLDRASKTPSPNGAPSGSAIIRRPPAVARTAALILTVCSFAAVSGISTATADCGKERACSGSTTSNSGSAGAGRRSRLRAARRISRFGEQAAPALRGSSATSRRQPPSFGSIRTFSGKSETLGAISHPFR